jgi:hypothetical protein
MSGKDGENRTIPSKRRRDERYSLHIITKWH